MKKIKVLLIDGNNIAHMSGYTNVMTTSEGGRVEVIFTGLKMIRSFLQKFEPDRVAIVWDGGRDERRKKLYPDYKKGRGPKTEAEEIERELFYHQMDILKETLNKLGLTSFEVPEREADDVIFNLMVQVHKAGQELIEEQIVVSSDKDFYQLFKYFDNVKIYNPLKKKLLDYRTLEKQLGFSPRSYVDYKAIVGDPSDSLPGIKGIGPVGAKTIIELLFSTDPAVEEITKAQHRWLEKFEAGLQDYKLMCELIEFMPIPPEEVMQWKGKFDITPNDMVKHAMTILSKFEFKSLLDKFNNFIGPFEQLLIKERKENQ